MTYLQFGGLVLETNFAGNTRWVVCRQKIMFTDGFFADRSVLTPKARRMRAFPMLNMTRY